MATSSVVVPSTASPRVTQKWWERLIFERPQKDSQSCPTCDSLNDSIDIVCMEDSTVLTGKKLEDRYKARLINGLRLFAVAVAFSVGYLNWILPAYVFGTTLTLAFFSLFLLKHQTTLVYFIFITVLSFLVYSSWIGFLEPVVTFPQVLAIIYVGLILFEFVFLVFFTSRIKQNDDDERWFWLECNNIDLSIKTLTTISLLQTVFIFSVGIAIISLLLGILPSNDIFSGIGLRFLISVLGSSFVIALVSSTLYSLKGEPFIIVDKWTIRPIIHEHKFKQIPIPEKLRSQSLPIKIGNILDRAIIISTNNMVKAFEKTYNRVIVITINVVFINIVKTSNAIRKALIKLVRHIIRTVLRFILILTWCASWARYVGNKFLLTYAIPIFLLMASMLSIFSIATDFYNYVHQSEFIIAIWILLKSILLILLFTLITSLLIHANIFAKMVNALNVFGTSAFLFFLLAAWSFGIIGMLTNGPYRIGPVTIISTAILIILFIFVRIRNS